MTSLISKLNFSLKKPKTIIILGQGRESVTAAISSVLACHRKVKRISSDFPLKINEDEILIFSANIKNASEKERIAFALKKSELPILVISDFSDLTEKVIGIDKKNEYCSGIEDLIGLLPKHGWLVYNSDDSSINEKVAKIESGKISIGFQGGANFQASDVSFGRNINFKANFKGSIVPVWLNETFGRENICAALFAMAVGKVFDLNMIQTSQALKNFRPETGYGCIASGFKSSLIVDASKSKSFLLAAEIFQLALQLAGEGKKIAIIESGFDQKELDKDIAQKAAKFCDAFFITGQEKETIASEALAGGLTLEKIFKFDKISIAINILQKIIGKGDLIVLIGPDNSNITEISNWLMRET